MLTLKTRPLHCAVAVSNVNALREMHPIMVTRSKFSKYVIAEHLFCICAITHTEHLAANKPVLRWVCSSTLLCSPSLSIAGPFLPTRLMHCLSGITLVSRVNSKSASCYATSSNSMSGKRGAKALNSKPSWDNKLYSSGRKGDFARQKHSFILSKLTQLFSKKQWKHFRFAWYPSKQWD